MTIRERGGRVQLIRNQYSPAKKRGVQAVIGTFDRYTESVGKVDSMLLEQLTADERAQLDQWFADKAARSQALMLKFAPGYICRNLDLLAENYRPDGPTDEQIQQIKAGLSALLEARRKWKKSHQ